MVNQEAGMRLWAAIALVVLLAACAAGEPPSAHVRPDNLVIGASPLPSGVTECARVEADGPRTICFEATVAASADDVWRLVSTSEGLRAWAAPVAAIDLRIGGIWETSYRRDAHIGDAGNIRNRVLSYAPGRMLSIAVDSAPPGFPHAEEVKTLWTVIEIAPEGARASRVRIAMYGYRSGAAYDELYGFFRDGNAFTLGKLRDAAAGHPATWGE